MSKKRLLASIPAIFKNRPLIWAIALTLLGAGLIKDFVIKEMTVCPSQTNQLTLILNPRWLVPLKEHVGELAGNIGERNLSKPAHLDRAADYIVKEWKKQGYEVTRQTFSVDDIPVSNLIVEKKGNVKPNEIVVVGAHYDTERGTPGADDNATGVASLLVLSKLLKTDSLARTVRFVAFVNEEEPYAGTDQMGSRVYAKSLSQNKENVVGMISLETMGYYSNDENSQKYPFPVGFFYPKKGNFIGFVGNTKSKALVNQLTTLFRGFSDLPAQCIKAPERIPGIGWSDHEPFWKEGYQALMITDTAPFRYPHYHRAEDTPEKIDYVRLDKLVEGLQRVLESFANGITPS